MPKLAIQSSVYPFDYNKNNPMAGYDQWRLHLETECDKIHGTTKATRILTERVAAFLNSFPSKMKFNPPKRVVKPIYSRN